MSSAIERLIEAEGLPADYREIADRYWRPLSEDIAERHAGKPLLVGINGAQGSGKSTLCKFLEVLLVERLAGEEWEGLARPSRKLRAGERLGPVELLEPLGESSPIAGFLEKNPGGGIHHVCYEVDDILAARDRLVGSGARVLGDGTPKIGAHGKPVLFLHPKDFCGTLVELEQA